MNVLMLTLGCGKSVTGYGYIGGTEYGAKRLVNRLRSDGINIHVIGNGGDVSFSSPPIIWRIYWSIISFISGFFYILFNKVDIIYARYSTYPLFVSVCLKYLFNVKLVASIHGGDIRHKGIFKDLITLCLKQCDAVVCYDNDEHIIDLITRGITPTIIPNGIDTTSFCPKITSGSKNRVLYIGGTRQIKGFLDIIEVSNDIRLRGINNLRLHLYSDGTIKSDKLTKFFDPVSNNEIQNIMECGDLFILPSYTEGVPGSLLEAMSSGMFVVASDLPFTRKVLDKKFLFKAGDIDGIVDLIIKFCNDKKSYFGDQAEKNREIVKEKYSIYEVSKQWIKLFKNLSS